MIKLRRKFFPHPLLSFFMLVLWLFMANDFSAGQILLGAIVGWIIPYLTQSFWPESMPMRRPWLVVKFLLTVLIDIVRANIEIAILILGPRHKLQPAFMRVPLDLKQDFTITIFANTISLTPGTVSVDLQMDEGYLIVHGLNVDNTEAAISQMK
ncbi:MAG TPA: Na+/H+ antiporter subunit E, partial [Marinobacter sp.]|nr:Na+/H+ antiporter subunit E [Marinobacter sp.]